MTQEPFKASKSAKTPTRLLLGTALVIIVVALVPVGLASLSNKRFPNPPQAYIEAVAKEVSSQGDFVLAPVINFADSQFAFARCMQKGRGLGILDLTTGKTKEFSSSDVIDHVLGYSPDNHFLLLLNTPYYPHDLEIFDCGNSTIRRYGEAKDVKEAVWLTSNSFCYVRGVESNLHYVVMQPSGDISSAVRFDGPPHSLTAMSGTTVAFIFGSQFWTIDVKTGKREEITPGKKDFDPNWLQYSPETGQFLFCSWDGSGWRHLYRLFRGQDGWQSEQETFDSEHTYNGRWIQKGKGRAYVGNLTNHFYVAVRPSDPALNTNLFWGGHVYSYTVSHDGDKIYAIASPNAEPLGIWEYKISERKLRRAEAYAPHFTTAEVIRRREHWATSSDGLKIPYFVVPPRNLLKNTKYPMILYIPVYGNQAVAGWDMFSQFFANIGVYHVAVNYRGEDGYGYSFAKGSPSVQPDDIKAVYDEMMNDPNVDKDRVFLMGFCAAPGIASRVIKRYPYLWAGFISISGLPPERDPILQQQMRVFYYVPDTEPIASPEEIAAFERWAPQVSARIMRSGDVIGADKVGREGNLQIYRSIQSALAEFIFEK